MILVTGGTGMLGAHLIKDLIIKEEKVRAIKRKNSKTEIVKKIISYYHPNPDELYNSIEWFEADMLDSESLNEAFSGIEYVYHAAAMVSFNPAEKYKMIDINVKGTANVVNACLENGIKKLCHVSSISALGRTGNDTPIDEETFRNPKGKFSGYSISKFRSELEVWRGITEGLNAIIVNPSVILGPGDWNSGSPSIFSNIARGLRFYTHGITGYVDVNDVVKSMILLMESDISSQRFIVSAENLSYKEIFSKIADSLGVRRPSVHANSFLIELALKAEQIKHLITGKAPVITRDTANSAKNKSIYSNKKLTEAFQFRYTPIDESVSKIADIYKLGQIIITKNEN